MSNIQVPEAVQRYAGTLLEAATEQNVGDAVQSDLTGLQAALESSLELRGFVANRLLDPTVFDKTFVALFDGKMNSLTLNFLRLLAQRRRVHLLPVIIECALQMLDARAGIATAQVRSAVALSPAQIDQLQDRLAVHTGGKVQVEVEVDEALRGGLIARIGDTVFDGSIETQLARLHQRLIGN